MDLSLANLFTDIDVSSLVLLFGWTIINKSSYPKKIFFKRTGNSSGQVKNIPPHTSVTLPDDKNYEFWDAETHMPITPKRQVIINQNGFIE